MESISISVNFTAPIKDTGVQLVSPTASANSITEIAAGITTIFVLILSYVFYRIYSKKDAADNDGRFAVANGNNGGQHELKDEVSQNSISDSSITHEFPNASYFLTDDDDFVAEPETPDLVSRINKSTTRCHGRSSFRLNWSQASVPRTTEVARISPQPQRQVNAGKRNHGEIQFDKLPRMSELPLPSVLRHETTVSPTGSPDKPERCETVNAATVGQLAKAGTFLSKSAGHRKCCGLKMFTIPRNRTSFFRRPGKETFTSGYRVRKANTVEGVPQPPDAFIAAAPMEAQEPEAIETPDGISTVGYTAGSKIFVKTARTIRSGQLGVYWYKAVIWKLIWRTPPSPPAYRIRYDGPEQAGSYENLEAEAFMVDNAENAAIADAANKEYLDLIKRKPLPGPANEKGKKKF